MPYVEELVSIGRAENGFILEVRVPVDPSDDDDICCFNRSKTVICKDINDVTKKIKKLLPALANKKDANVAFDSAFKEATGKGDD